MKKEALSLVSLIFVIIVVIVSTNLAQAKPACSDNSLITWDVKEINIGSAKTINNIGFGVIKTEERAFYKTVVAELMIDAKRVELSNKTPSQEVELLSGKHNVGFTKASDTKATIKIGDESKEIEEGSIETIKSLIVALLDSIETSDNESIAVKLLVGANKISLTLPEANTEKVTIGNNSYLIELISASGSNAVIKASKCATGELILIETIEKNETRTDVDINQTINNTQSNITLIENKTEDKENESTKQVTVAELKERLKQLQEENATKNESESLDKENPQKIGFFKRIINWFKKLFGFG